MVVLSMDAAAGVEVQAEEESQCVLHVGATMVCFTNKPSDPVEKSTLVFIYMDCESFWKTWLFKLKEHLSLRVFSNSLFLDNSIQYEDAATSN